LLVAGGSTLQIWKGIKCVSEEKHEGSVRDIIVKDKRLFTASSDCSVGVSTRQEWELVI
jgi:hypothetical protein